LTLSNHKEEEEMVKGWKGRGGGGGGGGGVEERGGGGGLLSVLVHEHQVEAGQGARTKIDSWRHRCTLPTHGGKEGRLGTSGNLCLSRALEKS